MSKSNRSPRASTRSKASLARLVNRLLLRSRADPNTFIEFCFTDSTGRRLRQAAVHRELQAFLSRHPRALVELPRDHGKSQQVCMRLLWELGRDPTLRIRLVCASEALAAERGRFLRDAIARNPRLRLVFPALKPDRPWEVVRFTIPRPSAAIGPTLAAVGIGSATTGSRADLLVCDDIVDVRALHSKAERQRVHTEFRENLVNLLEPQGRLWCLFTPWHPDDLNSRLKTNPRFALLRRAIGPRCEPVWPEKWPAARLAERRAEIGSVAFSRAYRLRCVADEDVLIPPDWIRFWHEPEPHETRVLAIDPAIAPSRRADRSALVVLGRTLSGAIHVLEARAFRVNLPELVRRIDETDARWQPDCLLFESNAAFAAIRDLLVAQTRFGPRLRGLVQTRAKSMRFQAFSIPVENGSVRLRGEGPGQVDPSQRELFEEMTSFPYGDHDDLLDAAASGATYLLQRPEPRIWIFDGLDF